MARPIRAYFLCAHINLYDFPVNTENLCSNNGDALKSVVSKCSHSTALSPAIAYPLWVISKLMRQMCYKMAKKSYISGLPATIHFNISLDSVLKGICGMTPIIIENQHNIWSFILHLNHSLWAFYTLIRIILQRMIEWLLTKTLTFHQTWHS